MQAIKKGVIELVDVVGVNKADGDNVHRAAQAAAQYRAALHILTPRSAGRTPPRRASRPLPGQEFPSSGKEFRRSRTTGAVGRVHATSPGTAGQMDVEHPLETRFFERLRNDPGVQIRLPAIEAAVADGQLSPALAAEQIATIIERG